MVDQCVRQLQPAGKQIEIATLDAGVRVDGEARGRVKLQLLRISLNRVDQIVDRLRLGDFAEQELLRLGAEAGQRQLVGDLLLLVVVDMAVGVGGGDYPLSLAGLIFRPRSIIGTITGSRKELGEVIALAQSGKVAPPPVRCMPKDSANEALDLLRDGKVIGRLVLADDV